MSQKLKAKISGKSAGYKASLFLFVALFAGVGVFYLVNSKASPAAPSLFLTRAASAPYTTPDATTVAAGSTFVVKVMEDSGTTEVNAVAARISYDATRLDATVSLANGDFKTGIANAGSGTIDIAAGIQPSAGHDCTDQNDPNTCIYDPVVPYTGIKKVAEITFTAKTTAGAAVVSFLGGSEIKRHPDGVDILGTVSSTNTAGGTYTIPDTQVPTTPTGLTAVVNPSNPTTSVNLSWTASTDNVGVTGYNIYRNGSSTPVKTVTGTSATDTGLTPATNYTYTVRATDAAGLLSANSNSVSVTTQTPADTTAPTVSVTAPAEGASVSGTSVALTATAADNVGVSGVRFYLDPIIVAGKIDTANSGPIGAEDTSSPYGATWNTSTLANGAHKIGAVARDAAGNTTTSTLINVNVNNAPPVDNIAPSVPTGFTTSGVNTTSFTLSWTGSTDTAPNGVSPSGVAGYEVYRSTSANGTYVKVDSPTPPTSNQSGLSPDTSYYFKVLAKDNLGNTSAQSASYTVKTAAAPKPPLLGDNNGDHTVNISDLSILLQYFKKNYPASDFNNTGGVVDIGDLSILLSNYGKKN